MTYRWVTPSIAPSAKDAIAFRGSDRSGRANFDRSLGNEPWQADLVLQSMLTRTNAEGNVETRLLVCSVVGVSAFVLSALRTGESGPHYWRLDGNATLQPSCTASVAANPQAGTLHTDANGKTYTVSGAFICGPTKDTPELHEVRPANSGLEHVETTTKSGASSEPIWSLQPLTPNGYSAVRPY